MALAKGNKAYAIPIFYGFDGERLFFQSHPGLKDEYLATCQEACFVVTEVGGDDDWKSVQVFGKPEKITLSDDALAALDALAKIPFPPEFGGESTGTPRRTPERMYLWTMMAERIHGRRSSTGGQNPMAQAR